MNTNHKIIIELSEEVHELLAKQGVNLYEELQQEIPGLRIVFEPDPESPQGSRDIVATIYAVAAVITAITPTALLIIKQVTPPNRSNDYMVDEIETQHLDGSVTIHRKRISTRNEERPWMALPSSETTQNSSSEQILPPENTKGH